MAPSSLQHRRTHNLLLISKLLNQRDAASPFTLVLDSLEQSGKPLLAEYIRRANVSRVQVVFVSFETIRSPQNVHIFVEAWKQNLQAWQTEVVSHLKKQSGQRILLIFDSLNALSGAHSTSFPALLSSFITPTISLIALYHTDVRIPPAVISDAYSPPTLTLLRYLATTIISTHSLYHVLAKKEARDRSHAVPSFGLEEGNDGVIQALGANSSEGFVLEVEHRRKSGRGVREWYFLPSRPAPADPGIPVGRSREAVILLEDHPGYRSYETAAADFAGGEVEANTTFKLGLTEKQRRDRDGVVLPYFDAQNGDGEGGRILYDMGEEDDFDEEEDEI